MTRETTETRGDCGGIVEGETATRESLMATGMSEADAHKVLAFRDQLRAVNDAHGETLQQLADNPVAHESEEALDLEADWEKLVAILANARRIVVEQSEDEALWFEAATASEAYLQQELRRLHAAIESIVG